MVYDDGDEEEQRPLTTADIRALLDELLEEQDARHKEEIRLQVDEQDARHKEQIRLQEERINAAHQEEIRAHKEQIRLLEEATDQLDRRFKDLEQASASSSPPQDAANDTAGATQTNDENLPLTNNQDTSNTQLTPNHPRRRISAILSFLLFRRERNEESRSDHDDEGGADNDSSEVLEEDTFSLMMLNKPCREIPCHPDHFKIPHMAVLLGILFWPCALLLCVIDEENVILNWSFLAAISFMMVGPLSSPWVLSMFTFSLQLVLGSSIIVDQTLNQSNKLGCDHSGTCLPFHVPLGTSPRMVLVQYLVVLFALATQNDIFSSLQTVVKLWNADNIPWDVVIGETGNRTWGLWICRILLPNILKFSLAVMILFATFVLIIQTTSIVDLLKDFTALLVVSQADNIMFHIANQGYFGENLKKKTEEVKAARWVIVNNTREEGDTNEDEKSHCWCNCCNMSTCVFFTLAMTMIGGLTYFVDRQYSGKFLEMKYPDCYVEFPRNIGNGFCDDQVPYNTAACGWDGGDCPEPTNVEGYINCTVSFPSSLGDGKCYNSPPYNTAECGWDGGDCLVKGYPNCTVSFPDYIGDGWCDDRLPYNTAECGWDGGDCPEPLVVKGYPNCTVSFPEKIGDGVCDDWGTYKTSYNTPECGYDGGDCDPPQ